MAVSAVVVVARTVIDFFDAALSDATNVSGLPSITLPAPAMLTVGGESSSAICTVGSPPVSASRWFPGPLATVKLSMSGSSKASLTIGTFTDFEGSPAGMTILPAVSA